MTNLQVYEGGSIDMRFEIAHASVYQQKFGYAQIFQQL